MSRKDREGLSKRQEMRERRRRAERRNRLLWIGLMVIGALLVAFVLIYPQVKPIAAIQTIAPLARPNVERNHTGNPNAPVRLVEFSDFQCPFCQRFWEQTEALILENYVKNGKVLFTYRSAGNWVSRNLGRGGVESENAAMAAYCAADQNKFWEYHDALFANFLGEDVGSFTIRRLQAMAENVGLEMSAFNACLSSKKYSAQVKQDFEDALAAGISGTPYFVITYTVNGQEKTLVIEGAQPFSVFQQQLDQALREAGAQ